MRLSEIRGDKAFEVLADLITPIKVLATDEDIKTANQKSYLDGVQVALRKYPKEMKTILALLELEDPDKYEVTLATLPVKVLQVANDPDIQMLFTSQGQTEEQIPSGSAMENTEASEE